MSGDDAADDGIDVTVADPGAGGNRGKEEQEGASAGEEGGGLQQRQPERRELVLANQTRLHPGKIRVGLVGAVVSWELRLMVLVA